MSASSSTSYPAGRLQTLAMGLRACSEELRPGRERRELAVLADELQGGTAPEELLDSMSLSPMLRELLRSALLSGQFVPVLNAYLGARRTGAATWRWFLAAALYPLLVLLIATLIFLPLVTYLNKMFSAMFVEFGLELPDLTQLVLQSGPALTILAVMFWGIMIALLLASGMNHWGLGGERVSRAFQSLPLVGRPAQLLAAADLCNQLSVLMEARVPLPEAFRVLSGTLRDEPLRCLCRRVALRLERGETLSRTLIGEWTLPELRSAFNWSSDPDAFADGLKSMSHVLAAQARIRTEQGLFVAGPIVFIVVSTSVGLIVMAYFLPLLKLLGDLS